MATKADDNSDPNIQIEPLTEKELKERVRGSRAINDPAYPKDWLDKDIPTLALKGFKYYKKVSSRDSKVYMVLRNKKKDKSIGPWTEEREAKLFHFFPSLGTVAGTVRPNPWVPQTQSGNPQGRQYLSTPILRTAIIPRDYVPTINVIRYFQMVKEMGFPGDFSKFINDMVSHHMHDCHGVELPYVFREEDIEFEEDQPQPEQEEVKE